MLAQESLCYKNNQIHANKIFEKKKKQKSIKLYTEDNYKDKKKIKNKFHVSCSMKAIWPISKLLQHSLFSLSFINLWLISCIVIKVSAWKWCVRKKS
jgi:hypothetical protein